MLNKIIPKIQMKFSTKSMLKLLTKHFCQQELHQSFDSNIFQYKHIQELDEEQIKKQQKAQLDDKILIDLMDLPEDIFIRQLNSNSQQLRDFQQIMSFLVHGTTKIQKGMLLKRINYIYEQIEQLKIDQDLGQQEKIEFFKHKLQRQMENFLKKCFASESLRIKSRNIDFSHPLVYKNIQTYCNAEEIEYQNEDFCNELKIQRVKQLQQDSQDSQETKQNQKRQIKLNNIDQKEFTLVNDDSLMNFETQKKKKIQKPNISIDYINNFQQNNEFIILSQKHNVRNTNWVFVQGLPYNFNETQMEENLRNAIIQNGPIQQIRFYKQCDYQNQIISSTLDTRDELNKNYFRQQNEKLKSIQQIQKNISGKDNIKKSQAINIQQKLKLKVKENKFAKLNKSFALVQFTNQEDKIKFMTESMRLFGLNLGEKCYLLEDADRKFYLQITNVQFGQQLILLMNEVNIKLQELGIPTFDLDIDTQTKVVFNGQIILGFENFEDSLRIQEQLDDLIIDDQKIKVRHLYGNLIYKNNILQEKIIFNQNFVIQQKLEQIKKQKNILQKRKD